MLPSVGFSLQWALTGTLYSSHSHNCCQYLWFAMHACFVRIAGLTESVYTKAWWQLMHCTWAASTTQHPTQGAAGNFKVCDSSATSIGQCKCEQRLCKWECSRQCGSTGSRFGKADQGGSCTVNCGTGSCLRWQLDGASPEVMSSALCTSR